MDQTIDKYKIYVLENLHIHRFKKKEQCINSDYESYIILNFSISLWINPKTALIALTRLLKVIYTFAPGNGFIINEVLVFLDRPSLAAPRHFPLDVRFASEHDPHTCII